MGWRQRRIFAWLLLVLFAATAACLCPKEAAGPGGGVEQAPLRLTVLFFNDLHGHLLPFTVKQEDGSRVEVGGIARMATLVRTIRAENRVKGAHTLLLVAGDILQGTPMSTIFQGKPDVEALNAMGVDAMVVGNHEFDFGLENFQALKGLARFPFLSSNLVWRDSGRLVCDPAVEFPLSDRVRVTVLGVTTDQLLTSTRPENVALLDVTDSVRAVSEVYERSRQHGPVILLSHSKASTDEQIALAAPGLVAIVGGHDQILLNPCKNVGGVLIFQAFEKGKYLGRFDLEIDPDSGKATVVDWGYTPITADIAADPEIQALVESYRAKLDARFQEVLGESSVFLDGERERIRYEETNLGNFVTDIMRRYSGTDIALLNAGSLRASIDEGPITLEEVFKAMPYENEIVIVELTGREIEQVLQRAVSGTRQDEDGGFLHVSGLQLRVRGRLPVEIRVGGQVLDPGRTYRVAITDFMASGGDGYGLLKTKRAYKTGSPLRELIVDTIRRQGRVNASKEGRIVREDASSSRERVNPMGSRPIRAIGRPGALASVALAGANTQVVPFPWKSPDRLKVPHDTPKGREKDRGAEGGLHPGHGVRDQEPPFGKPGAFLVRSAKRLGRGVLFEEGDRDPVRTGDPVSWIQPSLGRSGAYWGGGISSQSLSPFHPNPSLRTSTTSP